MMSKNYLKDIEPYKPEAPEKPPTWRDYVQAFVRYLHKPKTIFDFKDRSVFLVLAVLLILALQKLVTSF